MLIVNTASEWSDGELSELGEMLARALSDRGNRASLWRGWAEATAEPVFLTRLLDTQADRCPPFRVFFPLTFSDGFAADHPNVTVTALGGASAGRRFFADGADNVIPANISDISGLVSSGRLPIDVVLLQVSGPDETGRYNAGLGIEHLHAAIGRARLVITQVNPELPWTHGDTAIEPGAIDVLVPAAVPPIELPARPAGPIDRAIADHIARLVPDRATIELGLGAIPQAVTRALGRKQGLGVHSGAIGDGIADLMEAGIVDNRHKEIDPAVTVATMLMGTSRLYRFADRNPAIQIRGPRIPMTRWCWAISAASSRSMVRSRRPYRSGQRRDRTGKTYRSCRRANGFYTCRQPGRGGAFDHRVQSTDRQRTRSRIVAKLADGIVTTPRAEADLVVTEHGIAELRGRTLAERTRALVAVADPAFRAELERASQRLV